MALSKVMNAGKELASKGRNGDTLMAHLTPGEVTIPPQVMTEDLANMIEQAFKAKGVDPAKHVAGTPDQSINPKTGLPEFGFFSSIWHAVRPFIPAALEVAGAAMGVPTPLLVAGGAAYGGATGGVKGAITGGLQAYGASGLGSALGSAGSAFSAAPEGEGLSAAGNSLLRSSGLSGAGTTASNFLGHPLDTLSSGASSLGNSVSSIFNGSPKNITADGVGPGTGGLLTNGAAVNPVAGVAGATGGGSSSFSGLGALMNAGSGILNANATSTAADQLMAQQNQNKKNLAPFIASGTAANNTLSNDLGTSGNTGAEGYGSLTKAFNPTDLANDPGYQFQLQQGQQALDRQNAATGMTDSGAAMKAAQEFGQGLAGTTYNNAFNRNLQQNSQTYGMLAGQSGQGLTAAGGVNNANTNIGNIGAQNTIAQNNNLTGTLSNILGRNVIGYDPSGKPIYA